jgi:hypothetical protein
MSRLLYFMTTFLESGLSVFGIRGGYDQPPYRVVQTIAPNVEIRDYAARTAVETSITQDNEGAAFGRLFRYITGANVTKATIAMTVPVERSSQLIAMTVPVEVSAGLPTMRFFLPASVVAAGAPTPTEKDVRLVTLPPVTLGVIRYSGIATAATFQAELADLQKALAQAGKHTIGAPKFLSYDPPFTIPFLRRNEVALEISR